MTVQTNQAIVTYAGNGVTLGFPVPFRFLSNGQLQVTLFAPDGTSVLQVSPTDYSATGARDPSGGTVTMVAAPPVGYTLVIQRNMPFTQLVDYRANDPFPEESAEDIADERTMEAQQINEVLGRSLKLPASLAGYSGDLPGPSPLKPLVWNAAGTGVENGDILGTGDMLLRPDLADPLDGGNLVAFRQLGTGSVTRSVMDKLRERVSVLDFIPVAEHAAIKALTTTYDATADIQDAINSLTLGGEVYFPQGLYLISSVLNVTVAGTTLVGACRWRTAIQQTVGTQGHLLLDSTANNSTVRSLRFTFAAAVTPSAGIVIDSRGGFNYIHDIDISAAWQAVKFTQGAGSRIHNFSISNHENAGIICQTISDIYIDNFVMNAGSDTRATLGSIRLLDKCEGIFVSNGDVLRGVYSLVTDAASYTLGNRPAYCNFTNVLFDSAAQGSLLDDLIETEFVGCWFSGGRVAPGYAGCTLGQSDSVKFTNTRFFNCGSHGLAVTSTAAKRLSIVNCSANSNSFSTGAGVSHGIFFANGVTDFTIADTTCTNGLYTGTQGYGIFIGATCDNFSLRDNKVSGNVTGGINDASAAAAVKYISGNIGYRTQLAFSTTVLVGQSSRVGNHQMPFTPVAEDFQIMPQMDPNTSSVARWWIDTITSTQFTIRTNTAVVGTAFSVGIVIKCKGA